MSTAFRLLTIIILIAAALRLPVAGRAAVRLSAGAPAMGLSALKHLNSPSGTTTGETHLSFFQRMGLSLLKKRYKYQYYSRNDNNKLGLISVICASAGALDIAALFIFGPTAGAAAVVALGLGWPALGIAAIVFGILGMKRDKNPRPAIAGTAIGGSETGIFLVILGFLELVAAIFKR